MSVYFETFSITVLIQYIFRAVDDGIFKHLSGCRIECRVDTSPFANGHFHLRNIADPFIQYFNVLLILFYSGMRHTGGH